MNKKVITIDVKETRPKTINILTTNETSQKPFISNQNIVGLLTESSIVNNINSKNSDLIFEIMEDSLIIIEERKNFSDYFSTKIPPSISCVIQRENTMDYSKSRYFKTLKFINNIKKTIKMGRKSHSTRYLKSGRKSMKKIKGKFREAKKKKFVPKKEPQVIKQKIRKIKKPKVDRSQKTGWLKKLREHAREYKNE